MRETICSERDSNKLMVVGIADGDTPDTIYFADSLNSKLKRLNIKTPQIDEVRFLSSSGFLSFLLDGLGLLDVLLRMFSQADTVTI